MRWYVVPPGAEDPFVTVSQNPLAFVLRGAQIYPNKIALVHPDVEQPVYYTYSIL